MNNAMHGFHGHFLDKHSLHVCLVIRNVHMVYTDQLLTHKDVLEWDWIMSQNVGTIVCSIVNMIEKVYAISLREKVNHHLTSHNFCIAPLILIIEIITFIIHKYKFDETLWDLLQQPNMYMKLEVYTIGPIYLMWRCGQNFPNKMLVEISIVGGWKQWTEIRFGFLQLLILAWGWPTLTIAQ